jgi:hypothetical protein
VYVARWAATVHSVQEPARMQACNVRPLPAALPERWDVHINLITAAASGSIAPAVCVCMLALQCCIAQWVAVAACS